MAIQIASLFATIGAKTDGLEKGLKQSEQSLKGFGSKVSSVAGSIAAFTAKAAAAGIAMKKVYDGAKAAATLEYAKTRFDNLTASIGSTSDVLMNDLRKATSGMVSDAELVASAGDFMALGLAKTHDEVVRLTTVAGALGMNMNQLVLTLTNQTTMRFDSLGVSVAGFDEKVRALEASGLSASDAFTQAFLQQAEQQIATVGNAADSSVASFKQFEAAAANLKNELLNGLLPAIKPVVEDLTDLFDVAAKDASKFSLQMTLAVEAMEYFKATGGSDLGMLISDLWTAFGAPSTVEQLQEALTAYGYSFEAIGTAAADAAPSVAGLTEEEIASMNAALAAAEAQAKMKDELLNLTTVGGNYQGIIDLAYEYTNMLEEKEGLQIERQKLLSQGWSEQSTKVKELTDNIAGLDADMKKMADQVTLDMFKATIAVGGVTQAELAAYMQMAIDMGYMSEEGAKAAIEAYGNAVKTIDGYKIDEKTGNVNIDATAAFATLDLLQAYALKDKHARAVMQVQFQYGTPAGEDYDQYDFGGYPQGNQASGGLAFGGTPYIVGERGPELFVPNANGQIIPNNELGGNSDLLGDILLELQNQPSRMKVAIKEAFALVGG